MTLKRDVSRRQDILKYLLQLSEMVGRRARRYGVSGKTVNLYIRYADFYSSIGKQQTQANPINLSPFTYLHSLLTLKMISIMQYMADL